MKPSRLRTPHALTATAVASSLVCWVATAHAQTTAPAPATESAADDKAPAQLSTVVVTGLRKSQEKAIDLKRNAATIVDSISAQDIGKLPDTTIADSLQRISGVQIRREAGEGTTVNIRGLPQVGTLLNGEEFITAGSVTSVQPNYSDIPSQLFAGADVYKSSTGKLLGAGISGTINLRTIRPLDLKKGLLTSMAVEYGNGSKVDRGSPSVNGLVSYNDKGMGFLLSAAVSDSNNYNAREGLDGSFSVRNEGLAGANFREDGIPRGTVINGPGGTPIGYDLNGNGNVNDAYINSGQHRALKRDMERKRAGLNAAFQTEVTDDLRLTAEAFFTKQDQYNRAAGIQMGSTTWSGAQFAPGKSTPKVVLPAGFNDGNGGYLLNTVQRYDLMIPNFDSYNETNVVKSKSTNLNLELDWDNGGPLKVKARALSGSARSNSDNSYSQFSLTDGQQWSNGIGYYPSGNVPFNTGGFRVLTLPGYVDYSGDHPVWNLPSGVTSLFTDPSKYALKTISSEGNNHAKVTARAFRLDGSYDFGNKLSVDFGVRHGTRDVENFAFDRMAPFFAGQGASDPNGCLVKWKAFDVRLNANRPASATLPVADCHAGPVGAEYTGGITRKINDPSLRGQFGPITNMPGGTPTLLALNMKAMDDPAAFHQGIYPGDREVSDPSQSYKINFKQDSFYLQGNAKGRVADLPYSANIGVKYIKTQFDLTNHVVGDNRPYGGPAYDLGEKSLTRKFSDTLPSLNIAVDPLDDVKIRASFAKNMTILDLRDWAGGLRLDYSIDTSVTPNIFRATGGNQIGNPDLQPWRSTNYDLSFEWYNRPGGMVGLALYQIDIAKSIASGSVARPDIPDQDGVVRRGTTITTPIQQSGNKLKGLELSTRQRLDFLPGLLSGFGVEATYTLSLADTNGKDLAGNKILFGDNSRVQTNFVLWYERNGWQARLAHNHRSKRAAQNNFNGLPGMVLYQDATNYVDASLSYDFSPTITLTGQVSNLTNEYERYYVTWKDQKYQNNLYERKYLVGLRVKF